MDGTKKLPLLIIGKSSRPRCFKSVKTLPLPYLANKKAWMTGDLLKNWLSNLNRKFDRQHWKIAMIIDNYPAHPKITVLKAIELMFLSPNTTTDNNTTPDINVLDALRMLAYAWRHGVTERTIQNCFLHAGITTTPTPTTEESDDENDEDDIPLARLARLPCTFEEFVSVNADTPTSE
ncbi:tigger transposable element-derived protein 4-like [Ylistrum balloti]|uniref:tigger transposable element-derived protein 4-like n=1 Tax=Ylistrum balloti TaxID=509963 RepID=UPI002905C7CC|nr:tigger transposable element-derived protein 4-like [Ylistrum balloti]